MRYIQQHNSPLDRFAPFITRNLIFLNTALWLAQQVFPKALGIDITDWLGLHYWEGSRFHLFQLFSYMFLHSTSDLLHLLNNMFMLWMFGSVIERHWGPARYITFYLTTGLTAALTQEFMWYLDLHEISQQAYQIVKTSDGQIFPVEVLLNMPLTVGASGAIFGLLLAYGVLFPNAEMIFIFLPIPIKAKYMVLLFGLYELFMGVHATGSNIAHFAHLGGMIGGIILIYLWRKKGIIGKTYY